MKKLFLMICLSSLLLSACGKQEEPPSQLVVPIVTAPAPVAPPTEPEVIPVVPTAPQKENPTGPNRKSHSGMIDENTEFCTAAEIFGLYGFLSVETYGDFKTKENFSQAYNQALADEDREQLNYLQSQRGLAGILIPYAVNGSAKYASFETLYGYCTVEISLTPVEELVSDNLTLKEQMNYSVFTGAIYQQDKRYVYIGTTPGGVTVKFTASEFSALHSVLPEIVVMETKPTSTLDFDEYLQAQDSDTSTFLTLPENNVFIQYRHTNKITGYTQGEQIIFDREKFASLFTLQLCSSLDRKLNEQFLTAFGFKIIRTQSVSGFLFEDNNTPIFYGFDNDTGVAFMITGRGDSELLLDILQKTDIKNACFD